MKTKYFLIFLVLLLSSVFGNKAIAQRCLVFRYDDDGNRIKRTVNNYCYDIKDMEVVQEVFDYDDVEVYPNPTYESFRIFMPDGKRCTGANYELFDMSGVMLLQNQLYGDETEVDIHRMAAGVYLLKIINGDDVLTKMILKY